MKTIFFKLLLVPMLCLFLLVGGCQNNEQQFLRDLSIDMTPRQISISSPNDFIAIVEEVRSAVVGISATTADYYSVGSGVCVAQGGYILTNHHVISGAQKLVVYFADKTQSNAQTIWSDSSIDLAIIKCERDMPFVEFGDTESVKVGQDVIAIGTPLTLQFKHTVTKGIVSAKDRTLEVDGDNGVSYLQNLIQHDASINPGNSGGALISGEGKLIGINTLKASDAEGIGFAIPVEVGKAIVSQISNNESYKVPYLGIFGFDATVAQYYGKTLYETGVYVVNIDESSASAKAGLQKGDIIVSMGSEKITTMLDMRVALYGYKVGDKVVMEVVRDGQTKTINFIATERP